MEGVIEKSPSTQCTQRETERERGDRRFWFLLLAKAINKYKVCQSIPICFSSLTIVSTVNYWDEIYGFQHGYRHRQRDGER